MLLNTVDKDCCGVDMAHVKLGGICVTETDGQLYWQRVLLRHSYEPFAPKDNQWPPAH